MQSIHFNPVRRSQTSLRKHHGIPAAHSLSQSSSMAAFRASVIGQVRGANGGVQLVRVWKDEENIPHQQDAKIGRLELASHLGYDTLHQTIFIERWMKGGLELVCS